MGGRKTDVPDEGCVGSVKDNNGAFLTGIGHQVLQLLAGGAVEGVGRWVGG